MEDALLFSSEGKGARVMPGEITYSCGIL